MATIIIDIADFKKAEALLKDLIFKSEFDGSNPSHIKTIKLLKAREENIDFEIELAEKVCGDNDNYPYRSSYYLTRFFQDLWHTHEHKGETRRFWVENLLKQLSVQEISVLIEKGLFRKKDFNNLKMRPEGKKSLSSDEFLQCAIQDFREFIDRSISANETVSLIDILDLNINVELLFENKANTTDEELNRLIDEAKSRFLSPKDKHIAIEKLWDAFERMKTYFDSGKYKSRSAEQLVSLVSKDFDEQLISEEFTRLTRIGNNYRIRHHETDKSEIKDEKHLNYLFFRMLCLIDLCVTSLSHENTNASNTEA